MRDLGGCMGLLILDFSLLIDYSIIGEFSYYIYDNWDLSLFLIKL